MGQGEHCVMALSVGIQLISIRLFSTLLSSLTCTSIPKRWLECQIQSLTKAGTPPSLGHRESYHDHLQPNPTSRCLPLRRQNSGEQAHSFPWTPFHHNSIISKLETFGEAYGMSVEWAWNRWRRRR